MEYSELDAKLAYHERPGWSFFNSLGAARRFFRSSVKHMSEGRGGLAELAAMVELRDELNAAIDASAKVLLAAEDVSYKEIGEALKITKQAVSLRYPRTSTRPVGGQSAVNR